MKRLLIILLLFGFILNSCDNDDATIIEAEEQEEFQIDELDDLLTEIQLELPQFVEAAGAISSQLTRLDYMFGGLQQDYLDSFNPSNSYNNKVWTIAYLDMLPKIQAAKTIAVEEDIQKHLGVAKVIEAYVMTTLVDLYGDVPYSEIGSTEPSLDDAEVIYETIIELLDAAIFAFNRNGSDLENDYYYDNNFSKWIKLANTLKLYVSLNARLVQGNPLWEFSEIINSGNFISTTDDDFEFHYGLGTSNDTQIHPDYTKDYAGTGAGSYRSNWLMDELLTDNDPRLRYYFYRQVDCTPGNFDSEGNSCNASPSLLDCSWSIRPPHYTGYMVYCSVASGYWGRDHGNSNGIPPDVYRRTVVGLYPAAGKFDDDDFLPVVGSDIGGIGTGITPIFLASWVDFMRAEVAILSGDTGTAFSFMESGMRKSIDKTMSFSLLDPDADLDYAPTAIDISNFIENNI